MQINENNCDDLLLLHSTSMQEQQEVRSYIMNRPIIRPKTNAFTIIMLVLLYGGFCFLAAYLSVLLFCVETHIVLLYLLSYAAGFIFIARCLCIKLIECYQRYAKDETRRKCLCMPTCSEYAIIVLQTKPFVIAIYKIMKRLFRTCKGGIYKKDTP